MSAGGDMSKLGSHDEHGDPARRACTFDYDDPGHGARRVIADKPGASWACRWHRETRLTSLLEPTNARWPLRALSIGRRVALLTAVALAACGGGGGGGGSSGPPNQPPVAAARLSGEAVLGATTTFDTTGTADADGSISSHSWNYGDGSTGTADSHVYAAAGSYSAVLTVTDNGGATASATVAVTVAKCSAAGRQAATLSPFPSVCMQTTMGELVIEVYPTQMPVTALNFLTYVEEGFYNGLLFHRAEANFVVQGGGYLPGLVPKTATHAPIALESSLADVNGRRLQNWQYTVAMARTNAPDSATAQFFINLKDNAFLDAANSPDGNGYAVFGKVVGGMDVVEKIRAVPTTRKGMFENVPATPVVIKKATLEK